MGEWTNTLAILAIVLLNALLGFFQEAKAEKSLAALQKLAAPTAKVIRDKKLDSIAARELVPGDVVEIEAGDNVPADLRLLTTLAMRVEEAPERPIVEHAGHIHCLGVGRPDSKRNAGFMRQWSHPADDFLVRGC